MVLGSSSSTNSHSAPVTIAPMPSRSADARPRDRRAHEAVVDWVEETGYPPFRVLTRDGSQHLTMRT